MVVVSNPTIPNLTSQQLYDADADVVVVRGHDGPYPVWSWSYPDRFHGELIQQRLLPVVVVVVVVVVVTRWSPSTQHDA